jgi:hypothetical protein
MKLGHGRLAETHLHAVSKPRRYVESWPGKVEPGVNPRGSLSEGVSA